MTKARFHFRLLICLLAFGLHFSVFSQTTGDKPTEDEQLAVQYYQAGEFDKALIYYEKLFNKKQSELYYSYYIDCLIHTKDFKKGEKIIRRQIKNFPYDLKYEVDLGSLYKAQGLDDKAKKQYEQAVHDLSPNQNQVFDLAKSFLALKEYDYAIETYLKGRKLINFYPFNFELAEIYEIKKDYVGMINEYLDAIGYDERSIQNVQNMLQEKFDNTGDQKKNALLKTELLRRVQKDGDRTIYSELLLWMLMQQKDFDAAFVQAKALDKRKKEEGTRVMALASTCVSNEDYETAIKCYKYVISLGPEGFFTQQAQMELLTAMNRRTISKGTWSKSDLTDLEKQYQQTLHDLGKTPATAKSIHELAHLEAFYLYNTKYATELLNEVIDMPQVSPIIQAECKLELGDILLLSGEVWEASLKYSQVEKTYKHDPIGQEAKFRNAKVGYYTGDFKWAQAQLDVLKGATSKLIANDAMELSLFISENMAEDSNVVPMMMYARAELLSFQNKDEEAFSTFDSINKLFPNHALSDDILFKRAGIKLREGHFDDAVVYLQKLVSTYSSSVLADDALYRMGVIYEEQLKNKEKAMECYQELLTKYQGSTFGVDARKRFRALRGDTVN
ncbi:MAG: tetratricopeptide repeat protein [Bacteroidia bacterium]